MRIFITTMDEPFFMNPFIANILERRQKDIVGLATSRGGRFTTKRYRFDPSYAVTFFFIMGLKNSLKTGFRIVIFKVKKKLSHHVSWVTSPSIRQKAQDYGIPTWDVDSVNCEHMRHILEELHPDIIINQTQEILNARFISIPEKGVLNRHASLLPKNRGRLTPFWVLFRQEKETGVTIHFVTPAIDQGDIIAQKKIIVDDNENFLTLTQKGYDLATDLMLESLDKIESGNYTIIINDPAKGTYNSVPSLKDALQYRCRILGRLLKGGK